MNTLQICSILRHCNLSLYRGVYASDTLPDDLTGLFVVNLDPRHEPGTHWISIYISADRRRGEYFDSFGMRPVDCLSDYMLTHCSNYVYNRRQIQSYASKYCGYYCIVYCVCRERHGIDLNKFISRFTKDTSFNDALIHKAFNLLRKQLFNRRSR